MDELGDFLKLKRKVEKYKEEKARTKGSLDNLYEQLEEKFGVRELKKAKKLLKQLEREERDKETKAKRALRQFEKRRGNKLRSS